MTYWIVVLFDQTQHVKQDMQIHECQTWEQAIDWALQNMALTDSAWVAEVRHSASSGPPSVITTWGPLPREQVKELVSSDS